MCCIRCKIFYNAAMTQSEVADHWMASAERNILAAKDMFRLKHYDWSLFLWHLVVEKALKSMIAKRGEVPLPIHDLRHLSAKTGFVFTEDQKVSLKEITTFNIEARYEDYKRSFYKKATRVYAQKWGKICEDLYLWLKQLA